MKGASCRAYIVYRNGAAAINYHRAEGLCDEVVEVTLPARRPGREEWLTRDEAGRLILSAWRYREIQRGFRTGRYSRRHAARFMLVALYTGTRAGAICSAAFGPMVGHSWIDLDRGMFYRRPQGHAETNKRRPPVPLSRKLLAHLRRWKASGQRFVVEWNGCGVKDVDKAFRNTAAAALPHKVVTPHTLRHTAATWLMQSGTDPWQAAEYLGMSLKTLLDHYGHHHPDYLHGPKNAIDRSPMERQRLTGIEREHPRSSITKIAGFKRR